MPKLSIVIPVYNVKDYIIDAINSVIKQTIKPYEVLIVNDGSTDGSEKLIDDNFKDIPYIKVIHTKNQGLGEARNVGTRLASGDYIYYFDSDDLLNPDLVENFLYAVNKNPSIDLFVFSAESFIDPLNNTSAVSLPLYRRGIDETFDSGKDAFCSLFKINSFYPNAWIYIFRREIQVENALLFKPIIHEDEEFTPRLFFKCATTFVTDKVYFKRRVRGGSIMQTTPSERNIVGYIESIRALDYLASQNTGVTKRMLISRSRTNKIKIHSLIYNFNLEISSAVVNSLEDVASLKKDVLAKLAIRNMFIFRLLRFALKKISVYI